MNPPLLKKRLGVDLQLLTNREKTLLIDALKEHYGLPALLAQLGLARSSYFYHRARAEVGDKYLQVRQSITEIFESNHRCYGYRRLQASLARKDKRQLFGTKSEKRLPPPKPSQLTLGEWPIPGASTKPTRQTHRRAHPAGTHHRPRLGRGR